MLKRSLATSIILLGLSMFVFSIAPAAVIDGSLVVTDVTPAQFCAVWATTDPAVGNVYVYQDAAGEIPENSAIVTFDSKNHPPAEDLGVMKVKVMGLKPDTEYFFQTETVLKSDNSVYLSSIEMVKTEISSRIVENDVLAFQVSVDGGKPALGMLVIAIVEGVSFPVSGWVADGMPEQWGAVDANNYYDVNTHVNLDLQGGEIMDLMLFGGSMGSVAAQVIVPAETGGIQSLSSVSLQLSATPVPSAAPVPVPVPGGGGSDSGSGGSSGGSSSSGGGGGGGCFISALQN
jgi:hypothetical protein